MTERVLRNALRTVAILIALAAAIDPAVTTNRATKPEVAVLAANTLSDSALASRVADELSHAFTVIPAPFASAAATVIVGQHANGLEQAVAGAVFAVTPSPSSQPITLEQVRAPARAVVEARVIVTGIARVQAARGKQVEFTLLANGTVVDRATRLASGTNARLEVPLSFVPTAAGMAVLRVSARVSDVDQTARVDVTVDVRDEKKAVLFFDPRPSWMSTFVRRAAERDPRFVVTSRVNTSTNVSTDAGKPPVSIDDPGVLELYDVVVVGAPESLGERDVSGLDSFLRRRGGSVVLLFDGNKRGRYERLAPIGEFTAVVNSQPTVIAGPGTDSIAMRATEWMWPTRTPPGITVLAWNDAHATAQSTRHPMVWSTASGAGRLIVSGALDGWKFRDPRQSGFEKFWQETIAAAAAASPAAVELTLPAAPAQPNAEVPITVTSRSAALAEPREGGSVRSSVTASLEQVSGPIAVRLWPGGEAGTFHGTMTAPSRPGTYVVTASADGGTARGSLVVAGEVATANPSAPEMLSAFTTSRGGKTVPASRLAELPRLLQEGIRGEQRRVVWHPMRSLWWLLPFVAALSAEWWLRRRNGLP